MYKKGVRHLSEQHRHSQRLVRPSTSRENYETKKQDKKFGKRPLQMQLLNEAFQPRETTQEDFLRMTPSTCWLCKIFRAEENRTISKLSLEEVLQWSQSFENLVTSKHGPMIYKTYLKTEHSDENIEFWLACEAYKKITSQRKRISMARKLFTSYIQPQAPSEINIDSPARKAIIRNIQEPTQSCFDEAQRIIYMHMERDSYPRFLESQFYQKLKHSLQTNGNNSRVN